MTLAFPGGQLVRRLEAEATAVPKRKAQRVLPDKSKASEVYTKLFEDMYGYRGHNSKFYFLSPWEFMMLWECVRLPKPKRRSHDSTDSENQASWRQKAAMMMCRSLFRPIQLGIPKIRFRCELGCRAVRRLRSLPYSRA